LIIDACGDVDDGADEGECNASPVAKLVPPDAVGPDVFGCMAGTARIVSDIEAPVVAADAWESAGSRPPARGPRRNRPARSRR